MINQDRENFQYRGGDLVYIFSPLASQLRTVSQKIAIKYVGPVVVHKSVDPHNYLIMTLDGKILRGIFEYKRLKQGGIIKEAIQISVYLCIYAWYCNNRNM